ncbi:MAG: glycoside hydrolase, partial [Elusimicrobia bacterium]|nr:glycoside hydrolase [Elusimicrobiota bacterium]
MRRRVIIHGHFYQPPRDNPWTGRTKREATAFPARNWNERIHYECYKPNSEAELNIDGHEQLINNYEYISFNIGSTLSAWMIKAHVGTYRKILEADKKTSNAIALPFNHTILPLDSDLNLKAQISWGIREFQVRFNRKPVAMWLPECAVSMRVADELVKNGMKYMILTSGQALEVKRLGGTRWTDVSNGNIDVRRPYRLYTLSGHIEVFFSDHGLAADLAFNRLLDNPYALADRIERLFGGSDEDLLVTIATDGETFGHHHKGAEKGLAHLLKYELPARGIGVTNFEKYLSDTKVNWEVRIKEYSSWSCMHGVERWRSACGCGAEHGSNLDWREPLRESIAWLGDRMIELVYKRAEKYFVNGIEEGIKAYGTVLANVTQLEKF